MLPCLCSWQPVPQGWNLLQLHVEPAPLDDGCQGDITWVDSGRQLLTPGLPGKLQRLAAHFSNGLLHRGMRGTDR